MSGLVFWEPWSFGDGFIKSANRIHRLFSPSTVRGKQTQGEGRRETQREKPMYRN